MSELRIGEVARRSGLRASAIRYYEDLKLIAPSARRGGSRRYNESALERLALIEFAKEAGFTLTEIRRLIAGFSQGAEDRRPGGDHPAAVRTGGELQIALPE